ncbi:MAG: DUF5686 family protein [Luteibaculaceae bacterium]
MRILLLILFALGSITVLGQQQIRGKVTDKQTNSPLAFVTVAAKSGGKLTGGSTDIDGNFRIYSSTTPDSLRFSYMGYKTLWVPFKSTSSFYEIALEKNTFSLSEVEIFPGINPADLLMQKVIKNRDVNNPEKNYSFKYNSYNIFSVGADTPLMFSNDTTLENKNLHKYDSITNLFLMESITERKFIPPSKSSEKVLANRVSGVKNPFFALLATEFQSFSFYEDYITILGEKFLSPISIGATKRYLFIIEDTIPTQSADTTFILSFRPKKGRNFDGMVGYLYVSSNQYALEMVLATPLIKSNSSPFDIAIQQKYQFVEGKQWFPHQLNTEIIFRDSDQQSNFFTDLKEVVEVFSTEPEKPKKEEKENEEENIGKKREDKEVNPRMRSRSYITNIVLNPDDVVKKDFSFIAVEIDEKAAKRDSTFWNTYRPYKLSKEDELTYSLVDSIGDKYKFDSRLLWLTALGSGKLSYKIFNLELKHLMALNAYEGFRLGAGLSTNDNLSRHFSVGGYFAYGFRDRETKFGGNLDVFLNKQKTSLLRYHYQKDVVETGTLENPFREPFLGRGQIRQLFVNRMDLFERHQVTLQFRSLNYLQSQVYAKQETRIMTHDFNFVNQVEPGINLLENQFTFYETGWYFRYAHNEKIMRSPLFDIPIPSTAPVFRGFVGRGFIFEQTGLDYLRYELQVEKQFTIRNAGELWIKVMGGGVEGAVPYFLWANTPGTMNERLNFGIMANGGFETMFMNEFFNEQYIYGFLRHNFKSLLFQKKWFQPQLGLVFNYAIGTASPEALARQREVEFRTLDQGFYESGFLVNNLFKSGFSGLGVGVFHRFGPNAFERANDNWFFKLTSVFVL